MGLFDQFPYTNFHNLNLDWIIGQIKNIKTAVTSTADDAASASESAEAAAASAGSAAEAAETAGTAAALVDQVREDLDTINTEMTNFVQAHSGLYNETVLWTGTASAQGDTIELSDDIRNYKYIDVQATYKGATSSSSSLGAFPSNVVRFTPEMFTEDNAVLNIPYAYEDQLQICTVFMFWDSLDPTDYTKISLGYTRRVSINDHGDLDNAADPGTVIVKITGIKNIADAEVIDARVGEDDTVYSTLKQRLDAEYSELKSAIDDLEAEIEDGGAGSGLTSAIKSALLQLDQKVAYVDDDGQTYYDDLYDALYPTIVYTAITLNKSSLSFGSLNTTQTLVATTTPRGGDVTWSSSNTSVATVSQTGVVTSVGYGNATITAACGSLTATCSVAIAQATVTSISAVYTQSGDVYADTALNDLKNDLVVTANWSNGTTSTVAKADYTLSGTLEVGTSTITASYGGKTATFNVTVSVKEWDYSWDASSNVAPVDVNGTSMDGSFVDGLFQMAKKNNTEFHFANSLPIKCEIEFATISKTNSSSSPMFGFCYAFNNSKGNGFKLFNNTSGKITTSISGSNTATDTDFPQSTEVIKLTAIVSPNGCSVDFAGVSLSGAGVANNQYLLGNTIGYPQTASNTDIRFKSIKYKYLEV